MDKQGIYTLLNQAHFPYEVYEHSPVYTIEDLDALHLPQAEQIVKNLFLRDDKKKNFLPGERARPSQRQPESAGRTHPQPQIEFCQPGRPVGTAAAGKGTHVTPLGILNDEQKEVTVVFDRALQGRQIGIHPMENTATIFLAFADVLKLVEEHGNPVVMCDLD